MQHRLTASTQFAMAHSHGSLIKFLQWTWLCIVCTGAAQAAIPLRKRVAKVAVSAAAVAALTAAPAVAFDAELGEEVFDANCATCHSGGGNVLIPYKTLKKDAIEKYLEGGFNVTSILYQVCAPHLLPLTSAACSYFRCAPEMS